MPQGHRRFSVCPSPVLPTGHQASVLVPVYLNQLSLHQTLQHHVVLIQSLYFLTAFCTHSCTHTHPRRPLGEAAACTKVLLTMTSHYCSPLWSKCCDAWLHWKPLVAANSTFECHVIFTGDKEGLHVWYICWKVLS